MTIKTKKAPKKVSFDFRTIKTFEDASIKLGIVELPQFTFLPDEFQKPLLAAYKLMVIYMAINNGWTPDWSNSNQWKYFPWYSVLSSGFGFSCSDYNSASALTSVGSRLCTDTSEKALYIAKQFEAEYVDYFLYSK